MNPTAMTGRGRLVVLPVDNGIVGPLDGPFTLTIESEDCAALQGAEAEALATIVAFVRHVARGVSCYNGNEFESSSNLTSYASECMSDLRSDAPEAAARLESLVVDCSGLTPATKMHPIWKLDRAILRALPGVTFIE
jgi:hypothetical protein